MTMQSNDGNIQLLLNPVELLSTLRKLWTKQ